MAQGGKLTEKQMRGGVDMRGGGTAMKGGRGGRIGNPPHQRTDAMANKVRMLRALGNNHEVIAFACDVSADTLQKHYKQELELGVMEANARVGAAIFNTALGEKVPCLDCEQGVADNGAKCKTCHGTGEVWRQEPNTTAQIWWSKNRMGWTDRERIEHVGDGGGPVITEQRDAGRSVHARLQAIRERQKLTDGSKKDD